MTKARIKDNICPYCLSKLIDNDNVMVCTGNKLKIWESDFKRYELMDTIEKKNFLISEVDSEKFINLYNKWAITDEKGNRPNFGCDYTNQIFSPVPDNRIMLPDPLQVKRLEKVLKRPLTNEELAGDTQILLEGKAIELKLMVFPDDF